MASKGKSKNSEIPVPIFFTKDRLTDEIVKTKALLEILPEDSLGEITKKIVQHLVMTSYDPSHSVEEKDELFISFQKSLNLEDIGGDFGVIYSGICSILRMAIRSQVKLTVFFEDLTLLKFPPPVVEAMAKILAKSRPLLESKICQSSCRFPSLQKFRWRVDVIISSGSLSRIMRPIMLFQVRVHIVCCICFVIDFSFFDIAMMACS